MKHIKTVALLVGLLLLLAFPLLFIDPVMTTVAVFTLLFAGAATAYNLFSGYTGYISLGHAVYYGVGGYALALMCQDWKIGGGYVPFLLLPLVGLIAAVFAIPLGWIALRVRRSIFVVITLAIFNVFQLLAYNLPAITNGSAGMFLPSPTWNAAFFNTPFYYVALGIFLLALLVSWRIRRSKYGLGLLAIRDDEDRALSLGVRVGAYKLAAYVVSAFFIGMAGALSAYFIGSLYPQFAFTPVLDVTLALMALLGGLGTLAGPVVGALLVTPLQQYLTVEVGTLGLDLIAFGGLLLLVTLLLPEGIIPAVGKRWNKWLALRGSARPSAARADKQEEALLTEGAPGRKG